MLLQVLIDNTPHPELSFATEHGLSICFELDQRKWLLDMGASGLFAANASLMGCNIKAMDYVVISHAHADHSGGLDLFLNTNDHAPIILSSAITNDQYYSNRINLKRYIGMDIKLVKNNPDRFLIQSGNRWITDHVAIISEISTDYPVPKGNQTLYHGDKPDTFDHEIAIVVRQKQGLVVFTGCAHRGLLNILKSVRDFIPDLPVLASVGGTHLIDSRDNLTFESPEEIEAIASLILSDYPEMKLITGHCTGSVAKKIFAEKLKDRFEWFYSGYSFEFNIPVS